VEENITVAKAMDQRNGTPARTEEIHQFVALWQQLHSFHLTDGDDEIVGKFSSNGSYSSRSAYKIQFVGTFPYFEWTHIWQAKVENKCKVFSWLILQNPKMRREA
jgi:hypothetical protein